MMPDKWKYTLDGSDVLPINWSEIELGLVREENVLKREFTSEFIFSGEAAEYLTGIFETTNPSSTLLLYKRDEDWQMILYKTLTVDFDTYYLKNGSVSVSMIENTLRRSIEKLQDKQFTISVPDTNILSFSGLERMNRNVITPTREEMLDSADVSTILTNGGFTVANGYYVLPGIRTQSTIDDILNYNKSENVPYDCFFADVKADGTVYMKVRIGSVNITEVIPSTTVYDGATLLLYYVSPSGAKTLQKVWYQQDKFAIVEGGVGYLNTLFYDYTEYTFTQEAETGGGFVFVYRSLNDSGKVVTFSFGDDLYLWFGKSGPTYSNLGMSVLTFDQLIPLLFTEMGVSATLDYRLPVNADSPSFLPVLASPSVLSRAPSPTMIITFADIKKALKCIYGAVVNFTSSSVIIDYRENQYTDVLASTFTKVNNLKISRNSEHTFGSIKVGYETDSDVSAGYTDVMCVNNFIIPNDSENELDLVCPFKASPYIIEQYITDLLADNEATSQNDSDNFLFAVKPFVDNTTWLVKYEDGDNYGDLDHTYYNLPISPMRMLIANAKYIAVSCWRSTKEITFISSERFSSETTQLSGDVEAVSEQGEGMPLFVADLSSPIFQPVSIDFSTISQSEVIEGEKYYELKDSITDTTYQGFVNFATIKTGKEQGTTFNLLLK